MNGTHGQNGNVERPHIYWLNGWWRVREARSHYWKQRNKLDVWAYWIAAHAYVAWLNKQLDKPHLLDVQSKLRNKELR
ncbi:MAG: hypothetical protein JWR85_4203 [Marmoricola sp.]|nr:hypothetical protein [Marmoricola sp.]